MPRHVAGTEVYTHTLAKMQQQKGHEVAVVLPHIEHYQPGAFQGQYEFDGIPVHQFLETADPGDKDIYSGKKKPEGLQHFLQLIRSLQPDVVHFHELNRSTGLTVEHVRLAKETGARVFVTAHLSFLTCNTNMLVYGGQLCSGKIRTFACTACSFNKLHGLPFALAYPAAIAATIAGKLKAGRLFEQGPLRPLVSIPATIGRIKNELTSLAKQVDKLVVLADWYRQVLLLNGVPDEKITVIPQRLAMQAVPFTTTHVKETGLPIKLVFVGRIQAQKGLHLLLEALKNFSSDHIQFDIYGKEEDTPYYLDCRLRSRSMEQVRWKGFMNREAIIETLSGYDALCLPSCFSEMAPLVIQEAFAAGIPVIASRVYGNAEQVKHEKNGLLFSFNSSADLNKQLRRLVDDPSLVASMKKNIVAPGSFDEVCERYLQLYTTAVN